jgi:hypothetical protein
MRDIGIALELGSLLVIQTVFISAFAKFETETPLLKRLAKWLIIDVIVLSLYFVISHWALLVAILLLVPGTIYHFVWCKKNSIEPFRGTPRKKYYELRKWAWEE